MQLLFRKKTGFNWRKGKLVFSFAILLMIFKKIFFFSHSSYAIWWCVWARGWLLTSSLCLNNVEVKGPGFSLSLKLCNVKISTCTDVWFFKKMNDVLFKCKVREKKIKWLRVYIILSYWSQTKMQILLLLSKNKTKQKISTCLVFLTNDSALMFMRSHSWKNSNFTFPDIRKISDDS